MTQFVHNPKIYKPNEISAYSFGAEAAVERLDWIIATLDKGIIATTWNAALDAVVQAVRDGHDDSPRVWRDTIEQLRKPASTT